MKEKADVVDKKEEEDYDNLKKELAKKGFLGRLAPYNKPAINIVFGLIFSCIQGCIFPTFGIFLTKMLFALMIPNDRQTRIDYGFDPDTTIRDESDDWCLYMFLCAVVCFITTFT